MSLTYLLVFCVLAPISALAARHTTIQNAICVQCKAYELAYNFTIAAATSPPYISSKVVEGELCSMFPDGQRLTCTRQIESYIRRVDKATENLIPGSMCDVALGCTERHELSNYRRVDSNLLGLEVCDICMLAVGAAEAALDAEEYRKEGAQLVEMLCDKIPVVPSDFCTTRLERFVEQVTVPVPREVCAYLGMCEEPDVLDLGLYQRFSEAYSRYQLNRKAEAQESGGGSLGLDDVGRSIVWL